MNPQTSATTVAWLAFVGAAGGGVLWLFGSKFSRSLVTLVAVAIGAAICLNIPRWFDLPIGSWATAVGGALILGIAGYTLHTLWAGLGLALLLGIWGIAGTWIGYGLTGWTAPPRPAEISTVQYAIALWDALPVQMRQVAPMMAGFGVLGGLTLGIVWSRLAVIVLHSLLGATLMVGLGLIAMELGRPTMLRIVPVNTYSQAGTFVGLVLFGVLVQWRLSTTPKKAGGGDDAE